MKERFGRGMLSLLPAFCLLSGCSEYREFTLPPQAGGGKPVHIDWKPEPSPVLSRGGPGAWDAVDVLNPSVIKAGGVYTNYYSGFDGKTWRTGIATSPDGLVWKKNGLMLSPAGDDSYIAANGSVVSFRGSLLYYYQVSRTPRIRLKNSEVLSVGPWESWDERGVADSYVIEAGGTLYMYYLGMDRARRQRLGVAMSENGLNWHKLRSNPILELGNYGAFDENGLGEPAVWASNGSYWMLYTGRSRREQRRLGIARSIDGVHWLKLPDVLKGSQQWDSQVICDPTVLVEGNRIRVWFGGGDMARPDENIHGQIGHGVLTIGTQ